MIEVQGRIDDDREETCGAVKYRVTSVEDDTRLASPRRPPHSAKVVSAPSGRFETAADNMAAGQRREMPDARQFRPFLLGDSATL
ncbi:hypothetical protein E2C01_036854 [Portunus trituberculatus]|uniref:Uncharacterized protein n=1 Tax=Portunus trituberculatus TaxID=210409 RepID=A0A5B7FFH1_PORTR|nr:hypothetical protein [Portunus trituberculatus]